MGAPQNRLEPIFRALCGPLVKLMGDGALADKLKDFRRKISAAGRYTFEARVGKHDDLVLAVAIGLWAIVGPPKPGIAAFGTYSSTAPAQ